MVTDEDKDNKEIAPYSDFLPTTYLTNKPIEYWIKRAPILKEYFRRLKEQDEEDEKAITIDAEYKEIKK